MMSCPNCKKAVDEKSFNCPDCGYGLACKPQPPKRGPRFIGDSAGESRDEELGRTYRCSNCASCGGTVKRIAATGTGLSRLLDLQINEFIVVSCSFCGVVQLYDPTIVDKVSSGWPIIDFITGAG